MAAVKTYPLMRIALLIAVVVAAVGLVLFLKHSIGTGKFLIFVGIAAVLPFLSLVWSRRVVVKKAAQGHHLDLSKLSKDQLNAAIKGLDAAKAKGELTAERHADAKKRIQDELKAR